ncbi:hypothetical protein WCE37_11060 [Luteimonas sp. MJ250]|uniref:hypothetical protein n=1 Tax=Luteimonas sp. MJ250 TaxID=3129236 RepID=UPI0031BA3B00
MVEIVEDVFADYAEAGALAPAWRWELRDRSVYPKRSLINLTGGSGRPTIQVDDSGAGIRNFQERLFKCDKLEAWMRRCWFGTAGSERFGSQQEEMAELDALLKAG